jgi:Protein of unknown function (DUF998)
MEAGPPTRTVVVQSTKELAVTTVTHAAPARGTRSAGLSTFAGLAAGPLFLGLVVLNTWLSLDFLHAIGWQLSGGESLPYPSCLALGPHGSMQVAAFLVAGALVVVFALGLRRALPRRRLSTAGVVLLALFGAAIAASASKADWSTVHGDDPSTVNGAVHAAAFLAALPSILAATVVLGLALRGDARWRPFAIASPLVGVALVVSLTLGPHGQAAFLGFLAILFGWIASLAARQRRIEVGGAGA